MIPDIEKSAVIALDHVVGIHMRRLVFFNQPGYSLNPTSQVL